MSQTQQPEDPAAVLQERDALRIRLKQAERRLEHQVHLSDRFGALVRAREDVMAIINEERGKQKRYMNLLLRNSTDVLVITDADERIVYYSDSLLSAMGQKPSAGLEGAPFYEVITRYATPLHAARARRRLDAIAQNKVVVNEIEEIDFSGNGHTRFYTVNAVPMLNDDGEREGGLVIYHDTTELIAARDAAEAASRAKSDFLATMSHEIRTPMNAVIGMSELMLRKRLSPALREDALSIKHSATNLMAIINDILDFSKIESGKMEITPAPYSLASLINDVASIIRVRIVEKPILFLVNVDSRLPDSLIGDEVRLRQILLNLLSNAVKYTKKGYVALSVEGREAEGGVCLLAIEVTDTGVGIREDELDKLFSNFTRLDTKRQPAAEGTGLGLAITRNLCRMMGGDVTVTSAFGKGSCFSAEIPQTIANPSRFAEVANPEAKRVIVFDTREPYARSVVKTVQNLGVSCAMAGSTDAFEREMSEGDYNYAFIASFLMEEALSRIRDKKTKELRVVVMGDYGETTILRGAGAVAAPAHATSVANALNGVSGRDAYIDGADPGVRFTAPEARVLIVDDIATNLKVSAGLLSPYEMRVDICLSGAKAIEMVARNEYDVVFMDHMMPEMDGVEATAIIRAMEGEKYKQLPIIALTANAVSGMREMFQENGFTGYLSKPIDTAKLNELIERVIPMEKRAALTGERLLTSPNSPLLPFADVDGLDVRRGLGNTGGSVKDYLEVLALFCKDVEDRLDVINEPPDNDLQRFVVCVHAIKSAGASVGATPVSEEAAALEEAGLKGDSLEIMSNLPRFRAALTRLVYQIKQYLDETQEETQKPGPPPSQDNLKALSRAIERRQIGAIDHLLAALTKTPTDGASKAALVNISDQILLSDFDDAKAAVDDLIAATSDAVPASPPPS